jgi:cell wall-associated NlpC family hydrolase
MARLIALLGIVPLALLAGACASSGAVPRPFPGAALPPGAGKPPAAVAPPAAPFEVAPAEFTAPSEVLSTALALRGTPYRNGGTDPSGFDCSGFVQYVFARSGMELPREVREQYHVGETIDREDVLPGDLLFFETVSRGPSHVGVALGGDEFIHAPSSTGVVRVEHYSSSYWSKRFVGARRVRTSDP